MERGFKGPSRTSGTMIGDNPKSAPSLANKSNIFLASSLEAPGNIESQSSPKEIPGGVAVVFLEGLVHVKQLVVSIYLAFRSFWIIPNEVPSVSSHIAKYPMPGMAILGLTTLPPSVEIFLEKSSIEGTSIVFVTLPLVSPLS
jgi:hypothetical protein